jgi:transposase-like protein
MKTGDRRAEMERLLALREREGLTYAEAARRGGVSPGSLAWWSWRLRQGVRVRRRTKAAGFVEVAVVEDGSSAVDAGLELQVGAYRVRVTRGFDESTLQRLLRALSC